MTDIDVLLTENRKFDPSPEFKRQANVSPSSIYEEAARDPEKFWAEQAKQLEWIKPWTKVLEWNPPHAKWFTGGKINVAANCIDRHIRGANRNKAALIWEGEPGDRRTLTYWDLYVEVSRFANVLKSLGVKKGDRVAIYLPLIPEAAISMLACARIGAIHSVVFGGFSPDSLRDRINDAEARVLITADAGYRRGQVVPLKRNSDKALEGTPSIEHVVVVQRRPGSAGDEAFAEMVEGRDHWWHRLMKTAEAKCDPE
ncbi:MAG TPA: AMP-binding protein, partial [Gemmatimonadaceae bacterium]